MVETKLYAWPAALASGLTIGLLYVLCYLFIWKTPNLADKTFNYWFHGVEINMKLLSVSQFFIGLISLIIFTVLSVAFLIWIYNKCYIHCKKYKIMGVQ